MLKYTTKGIVGYKRKEMAQYQH